MIERETAQFAVLKLLASRAEVHQQILDRRSVDASKPTGRAERVAFNEMVKDFDALVAREQIGHSRNLSRLGRFC